MRDEQYLEGGGLVGILTGEYVVASCYRYVVRFAFISSFVLGRLAAERTLFLYSPTKLIAKRQGT